MRRVEKVRKVKKGVLTLTHVGLGGSERSLSPYRRVTFLTLTHSPDPNPHQAHRELGTLLAAGYLRLLASRDRRRPTQDSGSTPKISLDLSADQSDELAMSAHPGGHRA